MMDGDITSFYNSLTNLDPTIPVGVSYSKPNKCLVFMQYSFRIDISIMNYYCSDLINIRKTVLLPKDFTELMDSLKALISSGHLRDTNGRVLISPVKYGFEVYRTNPMNTGIGPIKVSSIRLITSNGWLFRKIVNYRYKNIIGEEVK